MITRRSYVVALIVLAVVFAASLHAQTKQDRKAVLSKVDDKLNTPLNVTLKWIRNEFSKNGTSVGAIPHRLTPLKFSDCNVSFRIGAVPTPDVTQSNRIPDDKEYSFNLGDLDPHSLTLDPYTKGTRILVGTWDNEPKIKIATRNAVTGETYRSNDTRSALILDLAETKSREEIRDELVHAIMLCQPAR
jgi:hypothetical protein